MNSTIRFACLVIAALVFAGCASVRQTVPDAGQVDQADQGSIEPPAAVSAGLAQQPVSARTRQRLDDSLARYSAERMLDIHVVDGLPPLEALGHLVGWLNNLDPEKDDRNLASGLVCQLAQKAADEQVRMMAIELLTIAACQDVAEHSLAKVLMWFSRPQFSDYAIHCIQERVRSGKSDKSMNLLAGQLDLRSTLPALLAASSRWIKLDPAVMSIYDAGWGALLALARMGDEDAMSDVIALARRIREPYGAMMVMEDLAYTRRPAAVRYLAGQAFSDTIIGEPGTDCVAVPLGVCALTYLAQLVEGFPLEERGLASYFPPELTAARSWLRKQDRLKLGDSEEQVRRPFFGW